MPGLSDRWEYQVEKSDGPSIILWIGLVVVFAILGCLAVWFWRRRADTDGSTGSRVSRRRSRASSCSSTQSTPLLSDASGVYDSAPPLYKIAVEEADACGKQQHHLILHFDVNKTIVMVDSVAGKSVGDVANALLANVTWGSVVRLSGEAVEGASDTARQEHAVGEAWRWDGSPPATQRPSPELVSYEEFWMERMTGNTVKKHRQAILHRFTHAGEPGETVRSAFDEFLSALALPPGVAGSPAALAAGLEGEQFLIVPAFFQLLIQLKRVRRSFSLAFRTFGEDLPKVVKEMNAFCEGRHPLYPGVCMDGSDGGADYRVQWDDPCTFGCFFRGTELHSDSLIMGTLEQPPLGGSVDFYQDCERFPNIRVYKGGIRKVHKALRSVLAQPKTVAIKDYWDIWRHTGEGQDRAKHNYGKLLTVDNCSDVQSIFFDDNILLHNPKIVDVRHVALPQKVISAMYSMMTHIHRADMYDAVLNPRYFINHIDEKSTLFGRRVDIRRHVMRVLRRSSLTAQTMSAISTDNLSDDAGGAGHDDVWHSQKQSMCAVSSVTTFQESGPAPED